jgi:molecular chaperone GrpE
MGDDVTLERDSADSPDLTVERPQAYSTGDQLLALNAHDRPLAEDSGDQPTEDGNDDLPAGPDAAPADVVPALLGSISAAVQNLASSAERYHTRAEQREAVIDHLHAELDQLRRGERRGLLRPLLVEICRLRDDLLREAGGLPADYNAERASELLRSYAESIELALENNGVLAFEPEIGAEFEPRQHRRVGAEPTLDPAMAGRVARIRRSGYLDVAAGSPIAPAEVVVFSVSSEPAVSDPADGTQDGDQQ